MRPKWAELLAKATEVCFAPFIGIVVGGWMDRKFGWAPWGAVIGLFSGLVVATMILRKMSEEMDDER